MKSLHGIEYSEKEKDILERVGTENEDFAICALFDHRNSADIKYNESEGIITVKENETEVKQTVEMITDVCESTDSRERIGVGVSMLEVAINAEQQWIE